jgi:hypothetical protein
VPPFYLAALAIGYLTSFGSIPFGMILMRLAGTEPRSTIRNEGEGLAPFQAPGSSFANTINNVWQSQSQQVIKQTK